jgi:protoporphyrinogen oxidase
MKTPTKQNIVIVGGGYLGVMCSILFSQKSDFHVTLIEKQNRLCGLYNSAHAMDGRFFDYGSRAILQTGVGAVDDVLFSLLPSKIYPKTKDNLREFSFQSGQFCDHSNCLDARLLPQRVFERGKEEMLQISSRCVPNRIFDNLRDYALCTYGSVFTDKLIAPVMKKLTGLPLTQLHPNALSIHGLNRIIIADGVESRKMKASSAFNDSRIAFAKFNDNPSNVIKTYPLTGGLSDFSMRMLEYLNQKRNVDVFLGASVRRLHKADGELESIMLDTDKVVECDNLIWTIPSFLFAKLAKSNLEGLVKPSFRNTLLAHFILDCELETDAHFVYNYDQNFISYRTSFYDNYSTSVDSFKSLSVEVFFDEETAEFDKINDQILDELISSNVVSQLKNVINSEIQFHRGSWPDFNIRFFESQNEINKRAKGDIRNVHFLGKTNGSHHSSALVHSAAELYDKLG